MVGLSRLTMRSSGSIQRLHLPGIIKAGLSTTKASMKRLSRLTIEAIRLDPEYTDAWNNKGNALLKLKRYSEADAAFCCTWT